MKFGKLVIILFIGAFLFSTTNLFSQSKPEIDSLIVKIKTMPDDTNKVIALNKCAYFFHVRDIDKTLYFANQGIVLSEQLGYNEGVAISKLNKGTAYLKSGKYEKAISLFDSCEIIMSNSTNHIIKAQIQNNLGLTYLKMEELDTSLEYLNIAYDIKKEYCEDKLLVSTLGNISICYYYQEKYDKALEINLEIIDLFLKYDNIIGLASAYPNIAQIYIAKGDLDNALRYLQKSIDLAKKDNNYRSIALNYKIMGQLLTEQKKYEEAIEIISKVINSTANVQFPELFGYSYFDIATNQFLLNRFKDALINCKESVAIFSELKLQKPLADAYGLLAKINTKLGNDIAANENLLALIEISKLINNETKQKQIEELQTKYETEKKEQEILSLKIDNKLQSAESKNKTYFILVLVLIILIIGISIYFYSKNQRNKHLQKINQERAEEAENQKSRFAKELHDGTGSNLTGIRLQLLTLKDKSSIDKDTLTLIINEVDRTHQGVRLLAYQALPPEFDNYTLDEAIRDLVRRLTKTGAIKIHYSSVVEFNWLKINNDFQLAVYRIIQQALSNIIKHSEANNADILIIQHDDSINVMIEDNGKGFDMAMADKGLGLRNIEERAAVLNARLNIDSNPGSGTSIIIEIPTPKNI